MVKKAINGGAVTFWSLSETFNRTVLLNEWSKLGLKKLVPEQRPPMACLRDSLIDIMESSNCLVRPLQTRAGFVVVQEQKGAEENQYQTIFTAKCGVVGQDPTFSITTDDTRRVLEKYHSYMTTLTNAQMASSLVKVIKQFNGTRLRESGGVYWLSGGMIDAWDAVSQATKLSGRSELYIIEHDLGPNEIVAVRDALIAEVKFETKRLEDLLASGELGERAVESRKKEARALREKVVEYEKILGVTMDALKKGLDSIDSTASLNALLGSAMMSPNFNAEAPIAPQPESNPSLLSFGQQQTCGANHDYACI